MDWRYIGGDRVTASFGLAADEAITPRQGAGQGPPALRFDTYRFSGGSSRPRGEVT